jgi:hypothetical protein
VSAAPAALERARVELAARCDTIEESYEFMLAYAAQGLPGEGAQIRDFLTRCDTALQALANFATTFVAQPEGGGGASPYAAFMAVLDRDARDARAAVQLVLAQAAIGSQLIDNLNASIHLRALLTDLFLFDEVLKGLTAGQAGGAS